jgi:molecular chaperone GrpE
MSTLNDCEKVHRELMQSIVRHWTLQKFGIERYGEIGEPFNPEVHQAVFEAPAPVADSATSEQSGAAKPSPSLPDGAILHVLKAGYRIHDRVLRPAEVGVVKNVSPST